MTNRQAIVLGLCGFSLVFGALTLLDEPIYRAIDPSMESRARLDRQAWYQVLRQAGSMGSWFVVCVLVLVWDLTRKVRRPGPTWARAAFVAAGAAAGGLGTELAKLILGRERPATIQTLESGVEALVYQGYVFRGLLSGFIDGSNLGLPSSHAGTAAGGAIAISMCFPRVAWVAIPLALGCGISRLLTGAHFATDVFAGFALAGILVVMLGGPFGINRPIGPFQRKGLRGA